MLTRWHRWPNCPASPPRAKRPARRSAGRTGTARTCGDGRRRPRRRRCGRPGRPRCSRAGRCSCPKPASPIRCWPVHFGCQRRWRAVRRRSSGCGRKPRCRHWHGCTCWRPQTSSTTTGSGARGPTWTSVPVWSCLVDVVTGKSDVPATVLAAVAHGELLTLAPFGTADGLVARGVSRLVTDRQRPGSTRSRRARGVLDAPFR